MPITFDSALGIHEEALLLRERRAEILAANLAHADTPHFKARDIDFRAVLADASATHSSSLRTTNTRHIRGDAGTFPTDLQYRVPEQPSLDGNTVDRRVEHAEFTENAVRYQSTVRLLGGKFVTLKYAIKGE